MKYLFPLCLLLSFVSCSPMKDFAVSDCLQTDCSYGLSVIGYDEDGHLIIEYGTGDLCNTEYWGDVEFRNDSLILIADKNNTGAYCRCGYILTYTLQGVDTCDLKIGVEIDYADFVKRAESKIKALKSDPDMSFQKQYRFNKKALRIASRGMYKSWKKRREFRKTYMVDIKEERDYEKERACRSKVV